MKMIPVSEQALKEMFDKIQKNKKENIKNNKIKENDSFKKSNKSK